MRKLDDINLDQIPARTLQTLCVVLIGLIELFTMVFGVLVDGPMKSFVVFYTCVAAALFVGIAVRQPMNRTAKLLFFTGAAMSVWMLLLQMSDFRHFSPTAYYGARFVYSAFLCEYLMLLPCGALLDEGDSPRGLRIVGGCYVAAGAVLCVMTVMVYLQIIPAVFSRYMGWFATRLGINWHPNLLARVFMVSFGMTLAFLCGSRKLWMKLVLGVLAAAQFAGLALTNSRTAIALGCCVLAGIAFFLVYRGGTEKGTVMRFFLGLAAALAVLVAAYKVSDIIVQTNFRYLMTHDLPTANKVEVLWEGQKVMFSGRPRELTEGMGSFNGRTEIWSGAFRAIRENPSVLLLGTRDPGALISRYTSTGYAHAHNSWIEMLLRTGLPGFLIALWITWLALKSTVQLMFFRKSSLFQKTVTMAVICMLGSEFFEPNLFYVEEPMSFLNILFMLCVGYIVYWSERTEKLQFKKAASGK